MDFNIELNKTGDKWTNGFSMFHTIDSRKDVTKAARDLILSKIIPIWVTHFENNPLLQMQSMIDTEKQSIDYLESELLKCRQEIELKEKSIAEMKCRIPEHEQNIRNIKRSFQTKDTLIDA